MARRCTETVEWPLGTPRSPTARTSSPTCSSTWPADRADRFAGGDPGACSPCFVAGSMSLGYGSIYTLLADLRDRYGFTEAELGVIVAAGSWLVRRAALARPARRSRSAPLLVRGGVVLAMGAMIGSAAATEFWAFLLARLLLGLGSGAVGPAIRRIVITRDPDAVGANLGRLAAFDVAGFVLGPLVAAVVAEPSASAHRSSSSPWSSSACSCSRAVSISPPEPPPTRRALRGWSARRSKRRSPRRLLPDRRHVRGDLGRALATVAPRPG